MSSLRQWRNSQHPKISQADLADRLGTTQSHVSDMERDEDKITLELAARIFTATGVRVGKMKDATAQDAKTIARVAGAA